MSEELKFPIVAHHRIIVNAPARDDALMKRLFDGFDLVEPLAEANASSGGKYVSFGFSDQYVMTGELPFGKGGER